MPVNVLISGPVVIYGSTEDQQTPSITPNYNWFPIGISENGVRITVNISTEDVMTDASGDVPHDLLAMGGNATITTTLRLFDDNANVLIDGSKLISRVLGIPEFAAASGDNTTDINTLSAREEWVNSMGMSVKHKLNSNKCIGFSLAVLSVYHAVAPIKGYIFPTVICEGAKDIQLHTLSVAVTWRTVPRWVLGAGYNLVFMEPIIAAVGFPAPALAVT